MESAKSDYQWMNRKRRYDIMECYAAKTKNEIILFEGKCLVRQFYKIGLVCFHI